MGKASRSKRDNNPKKDPHDVRKLAEQASQSGRGGLPVFWIIIGVLIVAGIVAMIATAPDDDAKKAKEAVADIPVYAAIEVEGKELPKFSSSGTDKAVGMKLPKISGTQIDGKEGTIDPANGAQIVMVVAHWCPHCNNEVPRVVEWAKNGGVPDGITISALSTAASKGQPNFPPAEWLAGEGWPFVALADDEADSGAEALGVAGYPFALFVNADGTINERVSGESEIKDFEARIKKLKR